MNSSSTGAILVFTAPAAGASVEAFNDWYDAIHVPEILEHVDGIVGARRLAFGGGQAEDSGARPFLAVYETDRPCAEVLANLGAAQAKFDVSGATMLDLEQQTPVVWGYDAL